MCGDECLSNDQQCNGTCPENTTICGDQCLDERNRYPKHYKLLGKKYMFLKSLLDYSSVQLCNAGSKFSVSIIMPVEMNV